MNRITAFAAAAAITLFTAVSAIAADAAHRIAIHVDQNNPGVMNLALNNAKNVQAYYKAKGETVAIEIVAYGPGLNMYTAESPVKDRISAMALEHEDLAFSACGNTLAAMEKKKGSKVELLSEAKVVPSGVIRLIELQESGYSYVKP